LHVAIEFFCEFPGLEIERVDGIVKGGTTPICIHVEKYTVRTCEVQTVRVNVTVESVTNDGHLPLSFFVSLCIVTDEIRATSDGWAVGYV